ncbi:MAG: cobalt transporter CbiM [Dissulfurimicrobium sp.]|uniref:cobalt transporter CbiM n=1 Tax=Dissulfurimicrobium TaxID=1769732 RepID=UPI001EDA49D0|nr:cobalt transporter CbiM [Dissulfurimicrobium hydrothermale]UKL13267.1 cobalt transporter CbiM [Dissulfurimicrobium hydrothermale]
MHIPDGYLSPQTYIPLYGLTAIFWAAGIKKIRKSLSARYIPYTAMAAAFSFLIMMFNIPIPGGTTGHAVGAAIVAILLGPWTAVIAISIVLIIQAFVFGDGGITAIGANCFNMAVVAPFVSYWIFIMIKDGKTNGSRIKIAAFLSGYIGLVTASLFAAIEFGIQPLIAAAPDGRALYAPYPLSVAIPAMVGEHALVFGILEGVVTLLVFNYFFKNEPGLIYGLRDNQEAA